MAKQVIAPRTDHLPPEIVGRVLMTVSCRDTDEIPKLEGAGSIIERDGVPVQLMHNGVVVEAGGYFGDWMAEIIRCLHGHHEPQEEAVFHQVVQRLLAESPASPAIVELGSFWSYYALWFCSVLPSARALLMEPDAGNLELGRRNFALNNLSDRAMFVHGVIGAEPGEMMDFPGIDGTIHPTVQHDLHSVMELGGLDFADVVLSDIQGAESVLLDRARGELAAGRVRFLIVSTHHHSISGDPLTHQRALELLTQAGGHVIAEHSVAESYSGDGLIAVSFDPRDKDFSVQLSHARAKDSLFGEPEWDLDAAWRDKRALELAMAELNTRLGRTESAPIRPAPAEAARAELRRWARAGRALCAKARHRLHR